MKFHYHSASCTIFLRHFVLVLAPSKAPTSVQMNTDWSIFFVSSFKEKVFLLESALIFDDSLSWWWWWWWWSLGQREGSNLSVPSIPSPYHVPISSTIHQREIMPNSIRGAWWHFHLYREIHLVFLGEKQAQGVFCEWWSFLPKSIWYPPFSRSLSLAPSFISSSGLLL